MYIKKFVRAFLIIIALIAITTLSHIDAHHADTNAQQFNADGTGWIVRTESNDVHTAGAYAVASKSTGRDWGIPYTKGTELAGFWTTGLNSNNETNTGVYRLFVQSKPVIIERYNGHECDSLYHPEKFYFRSPRNITVSADADVSPHDDSSTDKADASF